jgi:sulfofructose kinase
MSTGLATTDRVFRVERLDEPLGLYHASESLQIDGGAAANAAIAVSSLGGRSSFTGCVGDDATGDRLLLRLATAGVDITGVQRVMKSTPVRTVVHDAEGRRVIFEHVANDFFEGCDPSMASVIGDADAVLADARWPTGMIQTLAAGRAAGLPTIADADRPLLNGLIDVLELATHLLFTRGALMETAGVRDAHMALRKLNPRTKAWIGVTKGSQGISWIHQHGLQHHTAFDVGSSDTFAAGDVFRGAFALALAEGQSADSAVVFATAAAKCLHNRGHLDMPGRSEVDALVSSHPPDHL